MTLEKYLQKIAKFADEPYGRQIRRQFRDCRGSSELAMLQSPSAGELDQIIRAVSIMTPSEKTDPANLTGGQLQQIAADAGAEPGLLAIFFNGYALELRKEKGNV
jgi:hypothetical protein